MGNVGLAQKDTVRCQRDSKTSWYFLSENWTVCQYLAKNIGTTFPGSFTDTETIVGSKMQVNRCPRRSWLAISRGRQKPAQVSGEAERGKHKSASAQPSWARLSAAPLKGWTELKQAWASQVHPLLFASAWISTKTSQVPSLVWGAPDQGTRPEGATRAPKAPKQHFHEFALAERETQSAKGRVGFTFHFWKALGYFNTFWHVFFLAVVYNNPLEAWNWNMFDIWYILFFDYWQIPIYYGRSVRSTAVQKIVFFPVQRTYKKWHLPLFLIIIFIFFKKMFV